MNEAQIAGILRNHHARRFEAEPPYPEYLQIVDSRDQVLARFQPMLSAPEDLTESGFREFLAFENNQHWTGLQRPTKQVCDDMPRLRGALALLFDEQIPITDRLHALTADGDISVSGISFGILTPLLLVRYPEKYGVWNGKSAAALKALGLWPRLERGTIDVDRYLVLNEIFVRFAGQIELDLWCLDGLWYVINERAKLGTDLAFDQLEREEREYFEGSRSEYSGFRIERSTAARNDCIKRQGVDCAVCGFNFFEVYGELGLGYIHVHHVEDLSRSEGRQAVRPEMDLIPVCPNCHVMLHKGVPKARTVDELRELMGRLDQSATALHSARR